MERIPFSRVISDENLLKDFFESLSSPQKVTLKALYGLPLSGKLVNPLTGWSELDYWAIIQGSCEYDHLGYVTRIKPLPYIPQEYEKMWAIVGRRGGKTSSLLAFILAYEAVCGGHEEEIGPKQEAKIFLISQRLDVAQANINFVRSVIDSSPILHHEIVAQTKDGIKLKNGISIEPSPPNLKSQRGLAIPAVGLDEVAFWYSDPEAANPDFEVERAVSYSQLQFSHYKRVGISSPWSKEGLLWKAQKYGTNGQKIIANGGTAEDFTSTLVVFAPTAAFENPRLTRKRIQAIHDEDPDAFKRESLCIFPDSISGFFNSALLEMAATKGKGIAERAPADDTAQIQPLYVAAMDPAFRQDSFAFAICHADVSKSTVIDLLRRWTPMKGQKLNPKIILAEIADICKSYNISTVYSDQYQLESLQQIMLDYGMIIEGIDFTAKSKSRIFGSLLQQVNQGKLVLLDPELSEPAATLLMELSQLERRISPNGSVQISAPMGKHDDMPAVLALASYKTHWQPPSVVAVTSSVKEPTIFERCMATVRRRQLQVEDLI